MLPGAPRSTLLLKLCSLLLLGSCSRKSPPEVQEKHRVGVLSFVEDRYQSALDEARARKVPLFVDAWAPWCHTCSERG